MKFFDTDLEAFSCNLLKIKELEKNIIFRKALRAVKKRETGPNRICKKIASVV